MAERKPPEFNAAHVRDISVAVYKMRLNDKTGGGPGAVDRMLAKDGDGGVKLRDRAGSYDPLTRCYMRLLKQGVLTSEPKPGQTGPSHEPDGDHES